MPAATRFSRSSRTLILLTLVTACSSTEDGPAPEVDTLRPKIACGQQVTTPISISGGGLSPRVHGAMTDDPYLELPIVSVTRVQTLQGAPVASAPEIVIPDDRDAGAAAHVRWTSQREMQFEVFPELQLEPGIYDVEVKNPDGKLTVLPAALMIVARPSITSIERAEICTAQFDQVMVVTSGSGFVVIDGQLPVVKAGDVTLTTIGALDCATLGQPMPFGAGDGDGGFDSGAGPVDLDASLPVPPGVAICSKLQFGVKRDQLPVGKYSIVITNPIPAGCSTTESIELTVAPPPTVTAISPGKACAGGGTLTVSGTGFLPGARVTIGNVDASNVTVVSDTELTATFGMGLDEGYYTVTVQNADSCKADSPTQLQIVSGPMVFSSSPPVVWNGMATEVTFWASGLSGKPLELSIILGTPSGFPSPPAMGSGGQSPPSPDAIQLAGSSIRISLDPIGFSPAKPHQVMATIPKGTPAGTYDIYLKDPAACDAILPAGLTVTATTSLVVTSVDPPFIQENATGGVTVTGDGTGGGGFKSVPLVYLSANGQATAMQGVAWLGASRLTAVVPKLSAGKYDLIVVNPDGAVGVLAGGFTVLAAAPPQITSITPGSVPAGGTQPVSIGGSGFVTGASGTKVTLSCAAPGVTTAPLAITATVANTSTATRLDVSVNMTGVAAGDACVIRATNPDGSYADYSALGTTTPAENLSSFKAGTAMNVARRAPAAAAGRATPSARFVYAIGGDSGTTNAALSSVELAFVDAYGNMGAWTMNRASLPVPLTLAGAAVVGRLIYVIGGNTGTAVSRKVLRAEILDPTEVPTFDDLDIARLGSAGVPAVGGGVGQGTWIYRISAVMAPSDPVNPGGETLASEPITIVMPKLGTSLQVTVSWSPVVGAASYRVYRSPAANQPLGSERLVKVVNAPAASFTDTGEPAAGDAPLPLGSTGAWMDLQKDLTVAREGAGVALVPHPTDPAAVFLYAAGGHNSGGVLDSYEVLPVTVGTAAAQTVGSWTVDGTNRLSAARWQLGLYVVSHGNSSHVPAGTVYVYAGPGLGATTAVGNVDVGAVGTGGLLTSIAAAKSFGGNGLAGYGAIAASNYLYVFGGGGGVSPAPSSQASSALICGAAAGSGCSGADVAPTTSGWNSQGNLDITPARYLMGSALESAFFFLVGGQTATPVEPASKATALTLW